MKTTGSRNARRGDKNGRSVGAELKLSAKTEDVIDASLADFSAQRSEAGSTNQMLKVAKREYCFFRDAAFDELEEFRELDKGCALSRKVSVVIADPDTKHSQAARSSQFRSQCVFGTQY